MQTLQERVCEFQARLRGEEAGKRLQLQQGGHQAHSLSREHRGLVSPDLKQTQDLRDQHRLQDYHQIRTEATNTGEGHGVTAECNEGAMENKARCEHVWLSM